MLFQRKKQCIPFTGAIKLILVTDTHVARPIDQDCMDKAEAFGYDAVILMGDYSGQEKDILKENVRADQLFCLFGNHDRYDAADYFQANDLHEQVAVINGVRIAGIGGCLKYNEIVSGYKNQKESRMAVEKMPPADILITHASAYRKNENDPVHKGVNHPGLKPEACGSRPDHTICRHKLPGYSRLAHDAAAVMRGGPPVRGRLSWPAAGQGEIPTGYNSSSARCRTMTAAFTSRS